MMLSLSNPPAPFTTQTPNRSRHQQQHSNNSSLPPDVNGASFPSIDYALGSIVPSLELAPQLFDQNATDPMHTDNWGALAQFTPRMGRISSHQRESSLSSMGSAGPPSPYNHNTSNPQIAAMDSSSDVLSDMHDSTAQNNLYHFTKNLGTYSGYQNLDGMPEMAYPVTIPGPSAKPRADRNGLLPSAELANTANRSQPTSVASSVADDSPATPNVTEADLPNKRRKVYGNVPKLDRTMTDVYGDELYSPHFSITSSASPSQASQMVTATDNDLFHQRLNAANSQHLNVGQSPNSASVPLDRSSPFRTGSPLAPTPSHNFSQPRTNQAFNSAQRMREQANAQQQEAAMFQRQSGPTREPETPKTISPKDAILEFTEPEGGANFPLFPEPTSFEIDQFAKTMLQPDAGVQGPSMAGPMNFNMNPQFDNSLTVPQQYPFVARSLTGHDTPPRLSSAGSSSAGSATPSVSGTRPMGMGTDGGTYTCTYHGCTLRFDTPVLLQKHKREGHRQAHGLGHTAPRPTEYSMATPSAAILNTQAGPHTCFRINPSTGKPCKTVFSRPYDLTRHEDTIHNARKQKVRCDLCTEEKTFSRADALTRHYRVCHPEVPLPGKHRRRAA